MQAKIYKSAGKTYRVYFPVNGMSCKLFLEWWANFLYSYRDGSGFPTFHIDKEVPDNSEIDNDLFIVKCDQFTKETATELMNYINENQ